MSSLQPEQLKHRLLTAEEERTLARRIVDGERAMLAALVSTDAGLRALRETRAVIRSGELPIQQFLRNIDVHERARFRMRAVRLLGQLDRSPGARRSVARRLSAIRVHSDVLDSLEADVAKSSSSSRTTLALAAIRRIRRDIDSAKHELVVKNLRLVVMIAARYEGWGLSLGDLVQEGNIGLMLAVDKYDYRRGLRLSTYAVWWIRHVVQRALANQAPMIRLPAHLVEDRAKVIRTQRRFEREGIEPSMATLSEATNVSVAKVQTILSLRQPVSLDAPIHADSETKLGDLVANDSVAADEAVASLHETRFAQSLLDRLDTRERKVIERRFGLDGDPPETLATIGRSMSLTRERIRQIETQALNKLRRAGTNWRS